MLFFIFSIVSGIFTGIAVMFSMNGDVIGASFLAAVAVITGAVSVIIGITNLLTELKKELLAELKQTDTE